MAWTIKEMVAHVNFLADEDLEDREIINFFNDAIAHINITCQAMFPFISFLEINESYEGFEEDWQRTLLAPFAIGRVKKMDDLGSDSVDEFAGSLESFKTEYNIPDYFKNQSLKMTRGVEDYSQNPFRWG